jgi:hypothetical protein
MLAPAAVLVQPAAAAPWHNDPRRCGQSCLHAPAASTHRRPQTSPCRAHKSAKHTKMEHTRLCGLQMTIAAAASSLLHNESAHPLLPTPRPTSALYLPMHPAHHCQN